MARTNNLTNFLTDVAGAIKEKTGDSTPIPASQFDTKIASITTGGNYQQKSLPISQNGNYTLLPDTGYDAMDSVSISVEVPTIDTSDADAIASDVLKNKTAYVNGQKITGNIPIAQSGASAAATSATYNTTSKTLSLGVNFTGSPIYINKPYSFVSGAARVVKAIGLTADQIKKDEVVLGVTGTYDGNPSFTELEYIESTGTQYINLGILPQANMKFLVDYQFLDNWKQAGAGGSEGGNMFGSILISSTKRFFVNYYSGNEKFVFGMGTGQNSNVNADTNRHLFTIDTINWQFGVDTTLQSCASVNFDSNKTFTLFGCNGDFSGYASYGWTNPDYGYMGASRFYGAKIYLGNLLIMDLIPVKDGNNVACIYNKVNREFLYNQGTGTFIEG